MEEEIIKKEKNLQEYPLPISIEKMHQIIDQMKYCVCKIFLKSGETGTGFFCNITYKNEIFPVLITNFHIINDEQIVFSTNNDKSMFNIKRDNRKMYLNDEYDIAIIELKKEDGMKNFFDFDDNLFKENTETYYEGITIYDIQYPKSGKVSFSCGIIKNIKNSFDIIHLCKIDSGASGSPILDLRTNKVIGIHKSTNINFNFNKGTFLKKSINEYITKNIKKNINLEYKEIPIHYSSSMFENNHYYRYNYNIYFGCWNEILKCLCYIDDFVDYFKNNKFDIKEDSFTSVFKKILDEMIVNYNKNSKHRNFEIVDFEKIIKDKNNENFDIIKKIDKLWNNPFELLLFILKNLHQDLKKVNKDKSNIYSLNTEIINLETKFSNDEKKIIKSESNTIIAKLFFGIEKKKFQDIYSKYTNESYELVDLNNYKIIDKYFERKLKKEYESDDEETGMQNPIFYIGIDRYEKTPREIIESSFLDSSEIMILKPRILIIGEFKNLDFNWGGYDYTLFGLIGETSESRYVRTEYDSNYIRSLDIFEDESYKIYDIIYYFYCICKNLKTNKWFKYISNQIIEIDEPVDNQKIIGKLLYFYIKIEKG